MAGTYNGGAYDPNDPNSLLTGDWSQHYTQSYYSADYGAAGYDAYLTRSIDVMATATVDPVNLSNSQAAMSSDNSINYDFSNVTGSLGDIIKIGSINLDGRKGRLSIFDEYGNEAVILGNLDAN